MKFWGYDMDCVPRERWKALVAVLKYLSVSEGNWDSISGFQCHVTALVVLMFCYTFVILHTAAFPCVCLLH
jgi:hypothetical protein